MNILLFQGNLGFGVVVADNTVDLLEVHLLLLLLLQGDLDVGGVGAASPALHLLRLRLFPLVLRSPVLEPDLHLQDHDYNCCRILKVFGYFVIMLLTTTSYNYNNKVYKSSIFQHFLLFDIAFFIIVTFTSRLKRLLRLSLVQLWL